MTTECCRSCQAAVIWARTEAGKWMILDAAPDPAGNQVLGPDGICRSSPPDDLFAPEGVRHMPHWATCPNAAKHKRSRQ